MIYLIITASLNNSYGLNTNLDTRIARYIESIRHTLNIVNTINMGVQLKIKPIIVENNGQRNTFLDDFMNSINPYYNCDVLYTSNNNVKYPNKGVNELLDIKYIIDKYRIKGDDIVIKLTGRYKILDAQFLEFIINNADNYDAFIKFFNVSTRQNDDYDCVLGHYAIKSKYLMQFNYRCLKSPEREFAFYVRTFLQKSKLMEVNNLHLECCFADNSEILVI